MLTDLMMVLQEVINQIHTATQTIRITDKIIQILQTTKTQVLMKILVTEKVILIKRMKKVVQ